MAKRYILKGGKHGRFEDGVFTQYRPGDEITLTDQEIENIGGPDRVQEIGAPADTPKTAKAKGKKTAKAKGK